MKIFAFIILVISLSSCRTSQSKPSVLNVEMNQIDTIANSVTDKKTDSSYSISAKLNSWYSARLSIDISSSSSNEISAFLVNRRDSIIYLNINKFGIELARVVLTPDSVKFVNRFEKTYYCGNYDIIKRMYGFSLNFDVLQSILLCEDFTQYSSENPTIKYSDSLILISYPRRVNTKKTSAIHQEITFERTRNRILKNWLKDISSQQSAIISYHDFDNIEGELYPKTYTMELPGTTIRIETKSTRINIPGPTTLNISPKYTPMFPENDKK